MANTTVYTTPAPRFQVTPRGAEMRYWEITDTVTNRVIGQSFDAADARFIGVKVNQVCGQVPPQLRGLLALELCDFRMQLEHDNGGPLDDLPIALLLSDLCDFLHFNTGERAIVLGRDLLIALSRIDADQPDSAPDLVVIGQSVGADQRVCPEA